MFFWKKKKETEPDQVKGAFARLKEGLSKTRSKIGQALKSVLTLGRKLDDDLLDELGEALIAADVGPRAVDRILNDLRKAYKEGKLQTTNQVEEYLRAELKVSLEKWDTSVRMADQAPTVFLIVGVNGSGKTTSIAKLAKLYTDEGKKVLLAAADTYRAAGIEQLEVWAGRAKVDIVKHQHGGDPAAVAFDAVEAAIARQTDILIVDTAGRLQTKENLMRELSKIERVIAKKLPEAPHETFLVLDATTGQNAVSQAKLFKDAAHVTGIILTKLDGTAKGGVILGMRDEVDLPVKFIGIGEKMDDLEPFDPDAFVDAMLEK
jgi:fused signal recognition particle receptor